MKVIEQFLCKYKIGVVNIVGYKFIFYCFVQEFYDGGKLIKICEEFCKKVIINKFYLMIERID